MTAEENATRVNGINRAESLAARTAHAHRGAQIVVRQRR